MQSSGLNYNILRLSNIFGEGEQNKGDFMSVPSKFFYSAIQQGKIDLFDKDIKRDYFYIEHLCAILLKISKCSNDIFDIGYSKSITHREIAELVEQNFQHHLNKKIDINLMSLPDKFKNIQLATCAKENNLTKDFVGKINPLNVIEAYFNSLIKTYYKSTE